MRNYSPWGMAATGPNRFGPSSLLIQVPISCRETRAETSGCVTFRGCRFDASSCPLTSNPVVLPSNRVVPYPACPEPRNKRGTTASRRPSGQLSHSTAPTCSSSAAESPHARHAPTRRPQLRVPSSGDGWAAFADTAPTPGGRIENPTPPRGPDLVFRHVIAGAWNVRLTILFDQDGVAGEPPPLLLNTPFLRVRLGHAAIRRTGATHADDVVASLAAHLFHVNKCPIRECATHA